LALENSGSSEEYFGGDDGGDFIGLEEVLNIDGGLGRGGLEAWSLPCTLSPVSLALFPMAWKLEQAKSISA
jgi:hypothetical protein